MSAEALELSIKHWEDNVAKVKQRKLPNINSNDCALCKAFAGNRDDGYCVKCPVFEYTGEDGCEETPYMQVSRILDDFPEPEDALLEEWEDLEHAVTKELEFLKSLRGYGDKIQAKFDEEIAAERTREWEQKRKRLQLCYDHQQEDMYRHHSPENCDYCNA